MKRPTQWEFRQRSVREWWFTRGPPFFHFKLFYSFKEMLGAKWFLHFTIKQWAAPPHNGVHFKCAIVVFYLLYWFRVLLAFVGGATLKIYTGTWNLIRDYIFICTQQCRGGERDSRLWREGVWIISFNLFLSVSREVLSLTNSKAMFTLRDIYQREILKWVWNLSPQNELRYFYVNNFI